MLYIDTSKDGARVWGTAPCMRQGPAQNHESSRLDLQYCVGTSGKCNRKRSEWGTETLKRRCLQRASTVKHLGPLYLRTPPTHLPYKQPQCQKYCSALEAGGGENGVAVGAGGSLSFPKGSGLHFSEDWTN